LASEVSDRETEGRETLFTPGDDDQRLVAQQSFIAAVADEGAEGFGIEDGALRLESHGLLM